MAVGEPDYCICIWMSGWPTSPVCAEQYQPEPLSTGPHSSPTSTRFTFLGARATRVPKQAISLAAAAEGGKNFQISSITVFNIVQWSKYQISRSRSEENVSSPRETSSIRNWRTGTKYRSESHWDDIEAIVAKLFIWKFTISSCWGQFGDGTQRYGLNVIQK